MDIAWIRTQVRQEVYEVTAHAEEERQADKISIEEIEQALLTGKVLEECPDDPRGPSCLVLGHGREGYPIHVVCGQTPSKRLRIVTIYIPTPPKWIDPMTRRDK